MNSFFEDADLKYPSDNLTLGVIRAVSPQVVASDNLEDILDSNACLSGMLAVERSLAQKVFASKLKLPDPDPRETIDELRNMLVSDYEMFGLSKGPNHAREMIRDIEGQAIAQATKVLGIYR